MNIKDVVYFPRLGGYRFTPLTCAFAIESGQDHQGRWQRYHQCDRKASYEIDGYRFCTQHKNLIEALRRKENVSL